MRMNCNTFVEARARALTHAEPALRARWEALTVNEQRVSVALATRRARGLYSQETLRPLLEHWLAERDLF